MSDKGTFKLVSIWLLKKSCNQGKFQHRAQNSLLPRILRHQKERQTKAESGLSRRGRKSLHLLEGRALMVALLAQKRSSENPRVLTVGFHGVRCRSSTLPKPHLKTTLRCSGHRSFPLVA